MAAETQRDLVVSLCCLGSSRFFMLSELVLLFELVILHVLRIHILTQTCDYHPSLSTYPVIHRYRHIPFAQMSDEKPPYVDMDRLSHMLVAFT